MEVHFVVKVTFLFRKINFVRHFFFSAEKNVIKLHSKTEFWVNVAKQDGLVYLSNAMILDRRQHQYVTSRWLLFIFRFTTEISKVAQRKITKEIKVRNENKKIECELILLHHIKNSTPRSQCGKQVAIFLTSA